MQMWIGCYDVIVSDFQQVVEHDICHIVTRIYGFKMI